MEYLSEMINGSTTPHENSVYNHLVIPFQEKIIDVENAEDIKKPITPNPANSNNKVKEYYNK